MKSVPYTIVEEPTFVARFLLGDDAAGSVANVDAVVDLPDGSSWALTIFTARNSSHDHRDPRTRPLGRSCQGRDPMRDKPEMKFAVDGM